eukprot:TRINITY_DN3683_c0_g1_i1.p1 TRINITY_DN3683_c0_g1~~TRINITY_DN3683_c0_g1_i1.p1  ORF type:complete len:185 (-),score=44.27 TRINITY_DN3683_c0_g1_i1:263-817(-)
MRKKKIPNLKVIVIGTGGVGKSALTLQFMYGDFVEEYDPTSADSYRKKVSIDDEEAQLDIYDTAGQEEYAAMRDNYYRDGDGFMICYSITTLDSFKSLDSFRDSILRIREADIPPVLLVGNKVDLEDKRQVSREEGEKLADKYNCPFFETSAKLNTNVSEAFLELVRCIKKRKEEDKDKKCTLQ